MSRHALRSVDQAVSERDPYSVRRRLGGESRPENLDLAADCEDADDAEPGYVLEAEAVREIAEDLSFGRGQGVAARTGALREVTGVDSFVHDPMMP